MSKLHISFLMIAAMFLFAGCHQGKTVTETKLEQDVRLAPGEYVADEPESVNDYLEMLCREHGAVVAVHSDDVKDSLKIWQAVRMLDDFAAGRREFYPAEEVRQALEALVLDLGYWYSHGDEEDTNYAEIFFFRFLEQAVRLSPEVDFVTDFHCADGTAGILNYHEWSPNPLYSFLVYPTTDGLRVRMVGATGETWIEKLFHLTDESGREYYLCSNNGNLYEGNDYHPFAFRQFLFLQEDNESKYAAVCVDCDQFTKDWDDGTVVFNPRLLRWDRCKKVGDNYVRIEGTPSLLLILDGEDSRLDVVL